MIIGFIAVHPDGLLNNGARMFGTQPTPAELSAGLEFPGICFGTIVKFRCDFFFGLAASSARHLIISGAKITLMKQGSAASSRVAIGNRPSLALAKRTSYPFSRLNLILKSRNCVGSSRRRCLHNPSAVVFGNASHAYAFFRHNEHDQR